MQLAEPEVADVHAADGDPTLVDVPEANRLFSAKRGDPVVTRASA